MSTQTKQCQQSAHNKFKKKIQQKTDAKKKETNGEIHFRENHYFCGGMFVSHIIYFILFRHIVLIFVFDIYNEIN